MQDLLCVTILDPSSWLSTLLDGSPCEVDGASSDDIVTSRNGFSVGHIFSYKFDTTIVTTFGIARADSSLNIGQFPLLGHVGVARGLSSERDLIKFISMS